MHKDRHARASRWPGQFWVLTAVLVALAAVGRGRAAEAKHLERLSVGRLRLYYTNQGPASLQYGGKDLIRGMYFYTSVKEESGQMIEGFNFRRDEDGLLAFRKEAVDGGQLLTWYNKRHVHPGRPPRKAGLAGEATVTCTITGDQLEVRYKGKIEPNVGFGEIGFYVPEAMLTRGETGRFVASFPNGRKQEGVLPHPAGEGWNIGRGLDALTFESPRETYDFSFGGLAFGGSHGLHFQDFRKNDRHPGCFRIVLSLDTTKGNEFDFSWRLQIKPRPGAEPLREETETAGAAAGAVEELRLRPAVAATVRELPWQPQTPKPAGPGELSVGVDKDGRISLSEGGQSVVQGEYFHLFPTGAPERQERQDGGVRRVTLRYDAPKGSLTKEVVVSPDDVWILWTVKAKSAVAGEMGLYCPTAALRPPFITYRSVNQSTVDEREDLEFSSSYCIVSGGEANPREFQCGTSPRYDWMFQDFRKREDNLGGTCRFVVVPRLKAGEEWRGVFRYVRRSAEPYPAVSFDKARVERGILSTLLPDVIADGFSIVPARDSKYTFTNRPLAIRMKYYGLDPATRSVAIHWRLIDMWGEQVTEGDLSLSNQGRRFAVKPFSIAVNANGAYRMEIDYRSGGVSRTRELVFAVLPEVPDTGLRPSSVFGAAIGGGDYLALLAQRIGLKWNRCHCAIGDTQAGTVLPERGEYRWDAIAAACETHRKYRIYGCHSLSEGWKAKWLSTLWKEASFEEYLDAFVNEYVKPLAREFKGRITCWEVTNEPYYQYKDCPEKWVALMKATYEALKEADPTCTVVGTCGPPGSMGYSWYRRTFALGALDYQDAVSSHLYHFGPWVGSGTALAVRSWMREIRKIMAEHGRVVPLWNSETTVTPPSSMFRHPSHRRYVRYHAGESPTDPIEQAQTYFKVLVMHKIEDVKYSFHIFHGGVEYTSHTAEYDETPLAFLAAQATLAKHLEEAEYLEDVKLHDELFACLFRQEDRLILIPWGPMFLKRDRADVTLPIAASRFAMRDVFDNPLAVAGDAKETRLTVTWESSLLVADGMPVDELKRGLSAAKVALQLADEGDRTVKGRFGGESSGPAKRSNWIGFHPLDLSLACSRGFEDTEAGDGKGGWTDEGPNDLRSLPTGEWLINDVPFRIIDPAANSGKSCVVLKGGIQPDPPFPEKVTVPVGKRVSRLHFLHTVAWGGSRPGPAFRYVLHYTDGFTEEVEIRDHVHVANWWFLGEIPEAKVGWEGPNSVREKVRIWHATHEITHPKGAQAVLDRVEIVSECKRPIPVVIAITGALSN